MRRSMLEEYGEYETWRTILIEERSKTGTVVGNEKANVRFYE